MNNDTVNIPILQLGSGTVRDYYSLADYWGDHPLLDTNSRYVHLDYLDTSEYHILSPSTFHFGRTDLDIAIDIDGDPRATFGDAADVGADEFSGYIEGANTVSGVIFSDENGNGVQDAGEQGVSNIKLSLHPYNTITFSDSEGKYSFYKLDSDTITVTPESAWLTIQPTDSTLFPTVGNIENVNFAYEIDSLFSDFDISFFTDFRRCFRTINAYLYYENTGTVSQNITVNFTPDENYLLEFSSPTWDREVAGTYYWDIDDVDLFESGVIRLGVQMPTIDEIGETQISTLSVSNSDSTIVEETYEFDFACAYDPNDKSVSPEGLGDDNLVLKTSDLEYLIRFQNTGNDTAFDIRIVDLLSEHLDYNTFHFMSSSHDVRTELNEETGQLIFYFDDIQLVDSVANEPDSHGYVKFRIEPVSTIADSTVIENTAYIYFDFNPAIVTNTVNTMMADQIPEELLPIPTALPSSSKVGAWVYPNPTEGYFQVVLPNNEPIQLEVYSLDGRLVHSHHYQQQTISLDFNSLNRGLYILKVAGKEYQFSKKVIIK